MLSKLKNSLVFLAFITIPSYILDNADTIPGHSIADLYPVHGLDISHYQQNIDWPKLAQTNLYSFAYIKATEAHDFLDNKFEYNWENGRLNNITVGAYHFFSMRSSGFSQANYFISKVPNEIDALPPAIDFEIDVHQDPKRVRNELNDLIDTLKEYYQKQPIIYANYDTYRVYLKGKFDEHEIWIRDTESLPNINRDWLFWQYNDKGRVLGIENDVDLNVFNGTLEDLKNFTKKMVE